MYSRPTISNYPQLVTLLSACQPGAKSLGYRVSALLLRPPEGWLKGLSRYLKCDFVSSHSCIDRADIISSVLGTERTCLVMEMGLHADVGLLAAAAGTVAEGGALIIGLGAPLTDKETNEHPSPLCAPDTAPSLTRLIKLADQSATKHAEIQVFDFEHESVNNCNFPPTVPAFANRAQPYEQIVVDSTHSNKRHAEQNRLYELGKAHLRNQPRGCILITGRRGRGKSTLMARLYSEITNSGQKCLITAFHKSAFSTLATRLDRQQANTVSPEAALRANADILFIEEAAGFPLNMLQAYLDQYRHVVMCTTLEGYEASGRALNVRLLATLHHKQLPLLQLEPIQPWRWAAEDPLESLIDTLILRKPDLPVQSALQKCAQSPQIIAEQCVIKKLEAEELANNEYLLRDVHALLQDTHYQTTTKDIEHLLDSPHVAIWTQLWRKRVVAVMVCELEGNLPTALDEPIVSRKRRLPHQLLPQLIAQCANDPQALRLTYVRIVRLAVTPALRRFGLAAKMVNTLRDPKNHDSWVTQANDRKVSQIQPPTQDQDQDQNQNNAPTNTHANVSALGASFATDASSMAFWASQGYTLFHRGFRKNPRTGKQAVAVIRPLNSHAQMVCDQAVSIFDDNERARRRQNAGVSQERKSPPTDAVLSPFDMQLLQRFAAGERTLNDTVAAVERLYGQAVFPKRATDFANQKHYEKWLRSCVREWLQQRPTAVDEAIKPEKH